MRKKVFLTVEYQDESAYQKANSKVIKMYQREGIHVITCREIKGNQEEADEKQFQYKTKEERKIVKYPEILFFQKDLRKVRIHTTRGIDEFYGKINEIISDLDMNEFIVPHRSFIVNKSRIIRVNRDTIFIEGSDETIPVSKRYRKHVCTVLEKINYGNQSILSIK